MKNVKSIWAMSIINASVLVITSIFFLLGLESGTLSITMSLILFILYYWVGLEKIGDGYRELFAMRKTRESSLTVAHCSAVGFIFFAASFFEKIFSNNIIYRKMEGYISLGGHQSEYTCYIFIIFGIIIYGIAYALLIDQLQNSKLGNTIDDPGTNLFYLKVLMSLISLAIASILLIPGSVLYFVGIIASFVIAVTYIATRLLLGTLVEAGRKRGLIIFTGIILGVLFAEFFGNEKLVGGLNPLQNVFASVACGLLLATIATILGRRKFILNLDTWVKNFFF